MLRSHKLRLVLIVALVLAPMARAADVEPLPTSAELHKMFDAGQYQPLLTKLARVLPLKGDAGKPYDKVDLNILKAESCIQLKQQDMAGVALNDAIKATTPSTDPKLAADAHGLAVLLKHSPALVYTPKTPAGSKPINLMDPGARKPAYTALLADMQTEVDTHLKAAKTSKSLPPIVTATQSLADMAAVERMATGADTASQKAGDELGSSARSMMDQTLANLDKRMAAIEKDADKLIDNPDQRNTNKNKNARPDRTAHKAGLSESNRSELRTIIDTCGKIFNACGDLSAVSQKESAAYKQVASSAEKTGTEANKVLTADYTGNVKAK